MHKRERLNDFEVEKTPCPRCGNPEAIKIYYPKGAKCPDCGMVFI